jgi:hypothetical protein
VPGVSVISNSWDGKEITFGTDSTLAATDGYDLATGVGTPGPDFVEAVARRH